MFDTDSEFHAASPASDAKKPQSFLCPCTHAIALMLDPPPRTLPISRGIERPLRWRLGCPRNLQLRSLVRFRGHLLASITSGTSSLSPASTNKTSTSGFSASRRATTEPEEPDPPTMKS